MRIIEGFFDFFKKKETNKDIETIEEIIFELISEYFEDENFSKVESTEEVSKVILHSSVIKNGLISSALNKFKFNIETIKSITFYNDVYKVFYISDVRNSNVILIKIFSMSIDDRYVQMARKFQNFIKSSITQKYKVVFQHLDLSLDVLMSDIIIEI